MLPIGDDNRYRLRTPVVTWAFIAANVLSFIMLQGFGTDERAIYSYSLIPREVLSGRDLLTLLSSLFLHGGLAHIVGNMLFLSIFGDNVEDRLGHVRFFLFYLLAGILGSGAHVLVCLLTGNGLATPTLGASGAISGIMGAYLLLFPKNRVRVLLFNFIPTTVSAVVVIGLWFFFQLVNGLGYLGGGGGVAYAAHIGGFVFGFLGVRRFLPRRPVVWRPPSRYRQY